MSRLQGAEELRVSGDKPGNSPRIGWRTVADSGDGLPQPPSRVIRRGAEKHTTSVPVITSGLPHVPPVASLSDDPAVQFAGGSVLGTPSIVRMTWRNRFKSDPPVPSCIANRPSTSADRVQSTGDGSALFDVAAPSGCKRCVPPVRLQLIGGTDFRLKG